MRIFLAPMEGVVNHSMRTVLTELGGIDRCVTEFIRVTDAVFPRRVFYRYSPELMNGGVTSSGTPVYIQLLGSNPVAMAKNAALAARLGAPGIDINFGCPSKLVNRNEGGSILLRRPEKINEICSSVRQAVPDDTPVTVKIRLGYDDSSLFREITEAIFSTRVNELVIHARTKADGYAPPAHWHFINQARQYSPIPLIPNGEVWSLEDYQNCVNQSGCTDVMIGRGILAQPDLPIRLKSAANNKPVTALTWQEVVQLLIRFFDLSRMHYQDKFMGNPIKQWLVYLKKGYKELGDVFDQVKKLQDADEVRNRLLRFTNR